MSFDLNLYLVTDRNLSMGRDLEWIVNEAVKGGVTMVQLREKNIELSEFISLAIRLKTRLNPCKIPLIINDNIEVVLASNADGLHIGQSDIPYREARRILGYNRIIGLSVENLEQVREANELDVDYIGISPVFNTNTKNDTGKPFGLQGIRQVMAITRHQAVAIGGVNEKNAKEVMLAGANGIAVVSAICSAENPMKAAIELSRQIVKPIQL